MSSYRLRRAADDANPPQASFVVASMRARHLNALRTWLLLTLCTWRPAWALELSGQELAHDVYKGNCLACHQIPGDRAAVSLANIGPPLVNMRERFPDRAAMRAQIWDPTQRNPQTVMPPFGKHKVLTEEEIDAIVDYIYQY